MAGHWHPYFVCLTTYFLKVRQEEHFNIVNIYLMFFDNSPAPLPLLFEKEYSVSSEGIF